MHTRHRIGHLFIVFGLFSWLAVSVLVSLSPYQASAVSTSSVFSLSNTQRANNGLPALISSSQLNAAAQNKAQHMASNGYFAHTAPDGSTGWGFIKAQGYSYTSAGENLASTNENANSVVQGWMNSSSHRANLLSSTYTEVGYGSVYVGDWTYQGSTFPGTYFVVALYATPKATPPPAPPAPEPTPPPVTGQSSGSSGSQSAPQTSPALAPEASVEPEPTPEEVVVEELTEQPLPAADEEVKETITDNTAIIASVNNSDRIISPEVAVFLMFAGLSSVIGGIYLEIRFIRKHHHLITLDDLHLPHIG